MPAGYKELSTMSKGQSGLLEQLISALRGQSSNIQDSPLYQSGSNYLQQLLSGSPEATSQFEAPYMRQFNEQTIPALAERFSSLGSGAQRSSAFQQALGQAGAGLSENLASLRGGMQMQGLGQALGYAQQPISNFGNFSQQALGTSTKAFAPRQNSFIQQLLMGLASGGGQALGQMGGSAGMSKLASFL